ncbi:hypothetical protein L0F51_03765 [Afifella sp. H1R]|uniref:hypothetical protein n=1 Tax=Afifella sp. H1R TaxID=2908841 RepID=UPI001F47E36A|nr:hypothetical protein [Afifella sp. H1R]MCF1502882.1 hypothetical protein [Afifella sp. H1R]
MTCDEFRHARETLQLSVSEMAQMLGVSDIQVRRMQTTPDKASARPVSETTERLVRAYLDGYRPADWPTVKA